MNLRSWRRDFFHAKETTVVIYGMIRRYENWCMVSFSNQEPPLDVPNRTSSLFNRRTMAEPWRKVAVTCLALHVATTSLTMPRWRKKKVWMQRWKRRNRCAFKSTEQDTDHGNFMNLETKKWWTFEKVTPFGTNHAQFYMFYIFSLGLFQEDRVDESFQHMTRNKMANMGTLRCNGTNFSTNFRRHQVYGSKESPKKWMWGTYQLS